VTRRYDVVVGTGGIGTGIFLALQGNHTLGREESRPAELLDQRDYCKLHIVCHYAQRLLGHALPVLPVGLVGDDAAGAAVLAEMQEAGLDTSFVGVSSSPTLFSVCFLYPDGDGGNLSTIRSASGDVGPADVSRVLPVFQRHRGRGVAMALPEVPVATRAALLQQATEHGFLRVATFVPGEVEEVRATGMLRQVDLLSVNIDEAAALARTPVDPGAPAEAVVASAVAVLSAEHPATSLVVTAGAQGSWSWDGRELIHAPASEVSVVSTAGAGDAHLSGLVVATIGGLDLAAANAFAALVSGLTVTSPHTISPDVDAESVLTAAALLGHPLPLSLVQLLREPSGPMSR
jgi:ribokinase